MKLKVIAFILLTSISAFAADLRISGVVYRSFSMNFEEGMGYELESNGDMIIDIQNITGQTKRHYLQYNTKANYNNSIVRKVTIYAP